MHTVGRKYALTGNTCTTICHIKLLWNVLKSDVQSKSSQTVRLIPGSFFVYYLFHLSTPVLSINQLFFLSDSDTSYDTVSC